MNVNEELASIGEPPITEVEEELAGRLETILEQVEHGDAVKLDAFGSQQPELCTSEKKLLAGIALVYECAETVLRNLQSELTGEWNTDSVDSVSLPNPFPGDFVFKRFLGHGAFGNVWLADDLKLDRQVAMKTVRLPNASSEIVNALKREAKLLASVNHPSVIQVYAWRDAGEEHYLVMQYIFGGSLDERVKQDGPLDWHLAARYVADVGEGLLAVHEAGIAHRDIKPANILWDSSKDEALLTDFGISNRIVDARTVAGTPLYMAPEAFDGRSSTASDVYSLAATLFCLVTGQVPFHGSTWIEVYESAVAGLPIPDGRFDVIPEEIEELIRLGLSYRATERPPLTTFVESLRGSLNRLMADTLQLPAGQTATSHVNVQLNVSRLEGSNEYVRVASNTRAFGTTRDMKKVPPKSRQVELRTGDFVRVEVVADQDGFVTIFNIGPTGTLNLLYPDENDREPTGGIQAFMKSHEQLHILDIEMAPPTGRERLVAIWSRNGLPLHFCELRSLLDRHEAHSTAAYQTTRDMKRVQKSISSMSATEYQVELLELNQFPTAKRSI